MTSLVCDTSTWFLHPIDVMFWSLMT